MHTHMEISFDINMIITSTFLLCACTKHQRINSDPAACTIQWDRKEAPMQTTRTQMKQIYELSWVEKPYRENAVQDVQECKRICEDYRTCKSFIYRDHRDVYPNLQTYHCWFYGENSRDWVYSPERSQSNNAAFIMDTWFVKQNICP